MKEYVELIMVICAILVLLSVIDGMWRGNRA
jgi:hypothetical protein